MYIVNHHGDGNIALWLPMSHDQQSAYVQDEPKTFFVPPYVGVRGWLGVHLNQGLDWSKVADLVFDAYQRIAPTSLAKLAQRLNHVKPPSKIPSRAELNPMNHGRNKKILQQLAKLCLALPETIQVSQFGQPSFKAGKKTFATLASYNGNLSISTWVGIDQQGMLGFDPRYKIPAYTGTNGWIALDLNNSLDWDEIKQLVLQSYQHFALKRMLAQLT